MRSSRTELHVSWRLQELPPENAPPSSQLPWIPAVVPGCVHLDLMRAGVIMDPFVRMAERSAAWVDETDWVYEGTFNLSSGDISGNSFLVFKGLDTIAEIVLNDQPLGNTDNMFIPHEFPVGTLLREGENKLRIVFRSALRVGRERQQAWANEGNDTLDPHWFVWGPRSFVRKAQYMYGWDWGPELVSCGIWKPIELVNVPVARLLDWRYDVEFSSDDRAIVHIEAFVERAPQNRSTPVSIELKIPNTFSWWTDSDPTGLPPVFADVPFEEGRVGLKLDLVIENPRRWYPNACQPGEGIGPALYEVELLLQAAGKCIDHMKGRIGLRTIELAREADADKNGESFKFRVNGQDVFAKGTNWIPSDSFPSRLTHDVHVERDFRFPFHARNSDTRVYESLRYAANAHMNMLRVWGGGLYESEHFYDLCDALGIMVWQDFPYACAYYPDAGEYADAARAEAVAAVRSLRVHPSLVAWCGNNENHQMHHDGWSGKNRPPRFLGEKLYHEILPGVVDEEDPGRPYIPSSPIGGESPNSQDFGDRHDWDVWHGVGDWIHYRKDNSRFVSEFGFASSCGLTAWNLVLSERDKSPRSAVVRWHDKTRKGYETYLGFVALHFPEPQTIEDLVYYSQLNQAEAMKCAIEHWRRNKGRCWGTLFWQLNDCWPVQSWSVIDSEGEPKAAYYAVKCAYEPVLLSLVRQEEQVIAHLTNDMSKPVDGTLDLTIETFGGQVLHSERMAVNVVANGTSAVGSIPLDASIGRETEVYVHGAIEKNVYTSSIMLLAEPKELRLPDPALKVDNFWEDPECLVVSISSTSFAPYVWLRVRNRTGWSHRRPGQRHDRGDWNDNFFHMLAGESRDIVWYKSDELSSIEELRGRLTIRSL